MRKFGSPLGTAVARYESGALATLNPMELDVPVERLTGLERQGNVPPYGGESMRRVVRAS
jgi:hypothetical protein